jgi:hypothetical protein
MHAVVCGESAEELKRADAVGKATTHVFESLRLLYFLIFRKDSQARFLFSPLAQVSLLRHWRDWHNGGRPQILRNP